MPAQVTTRAQVNGYRFLIRRLEQNKDFDALRNEAEYQKLVAELKQMK